MSDTHDQPAPATPAELGHATGSAAPPPAGHDESPLQQNPLDDYDRMPIFRTGIAGVLMGLANLVPGVSGGTMVLVMGLYDEFVSSVADATRLRFTRRSFIFVAIMVMCAGAAIGGGAGVMKSLIGNHRSAMYALFIGMTLGGAPLLVRMLKPVKTSSMIGIAAGITLMAAIAWFNPGEPPDKEAIKAAGFVVQVDYSRDLVAGVLGIAAMVLPGISGAYMLLVMGRYEMILGAISEGKHWLLSGGSDGDIVGVLQVVVPVGIGVIIGLVGLSNLLKWLLHKYPDSTLGVLLGILLGSVIGIWPFGESSTAVDYAIGVALSLGGLAGTFALSQVGAGADTTA